MKLFITLFFSFAALISVAQTNHFVVTMKTSVSENGGMLTFVLHNQTPQHRDNFVKQAKEGQYDGTLFHQIVANSFVLGGDPNTKDLDPTNDGAGGNQNPIPAEFQANLTHQFGAIAAYRLADDVKKASNGLQFYFVTNPAGIPERNMEYTVFGKVIQGQNVLNALNRSTSGQVKIVQCQVKQLTDTEMNAQFPGWQ